MGMDTSLILETCERGIFYRCVEDEDLPITVIDRHGNEVELLGIVTATIHGIDREIKITGRIVNSREVREYSKQIGESNGNCEGSNCNIIGEGISGEDKTISEEELIPVREGLGTI